MKFKMVHENYNVADLDKSIAFYEKALGLHEVRRKNGEGFILVYMGTEEGNFELELTWLEEHPQPYDLGECEFHWLLRQKTMKQHISSTKKWTASAMRIRQWEFISSLIRTDTGWRLCRRESKICTVNLANARNAYHSQMGLPIT